MEKPSCIGFFTIAALLIVLHDESAHAQSDSAMHLVQAQENTRNCILPVNLAHAWMQEQFAVCPESLTAGNPVKTADLALAARTQRSPQQKSDSVAATADTAPPEGTLSSGRQGQSAVSVRDAGAACDDRTDDSAAIQGALDKRASDKGGTLLIPAGATCAIAKTLRIGTATTILGEGRSSVVKALPNFSGKYMFEYKVPDGSGFFGGMRDFRIVVRDLVDWAIYADAWQHMIIENIEVNDPHLGGLELTTTQNSPSGVQLDTATHHIRGLYVANGDENPRAARVAFVHGGHHGLATDIEFENCGTVVGHQAAPF